MTPEAQRTIVWMLTIVAIVIVLAAIIGCTPRVGTDIDMRCDTPGTVHLDGPDFACYLAAEGRL